MSTGRLARALRKCRELGSKEEGREWGGGWLRQRAAAIPEHEQEYGAYFRVAQWPSPLMMKCFS